MVGGVTLGYWATGSVSSATRPISTKRMASTLASTGRSMKNLAIIARARASSRRRRGVGGERGDRHRPWGDLFPRHGMSEPIHHHAILSRETGEDLAQRPELLPGRDVALLDPIVLVQHQQ